MIYFLPYKLDDQFWRFMQEAVEEGGGADTKEFCPLETLDQIVFNICISEEEGT